MTKQEYLQLKEEQKARATRIKTKKPLYRKTQSEYDKACIKWLNEFKHQDRWDFHCSKTAEPFKSDFRLHYYEGESADFRCYHIFLCLLRGRTREQIENNYSADNYNLDYDVETGVKDLCRKYGIKILEEGHATTKRPDLCVVGCDSVLKVDRPWARKKSVMALTAQINEAE